ncbi:hypothetical protein SAMN05421837_107311 [Amycolatopsis pretoriensis]|uniref:Uncharacterized protein n=1 Tax=Amycolatopsis pretoriensis TaxID=218821 RepID=A0A1H5R9P0_9PSEU|nr:hypothetical protein [Amycolatopsis pretoriensis]SEF34301.1 hypothetical protein SAMN05421837_107311 [Amycolatopsis pretoriensis]
MTRTLIATVETYPARTATVRTSYYDDGSRNFRLFVDGCRINDYATKRGVESALEKRDITDVTPWLVDDLANTLFYRIYRWDENGNPVYPTGFLFADRRHAQQRVDRYHADPLQAGREYDIEEVML